MNYKRLGDYIQLCDERNTRLGLSFVRGVSITKKFIATKANMSGVNISDYRVVRNGHFSFNPNTARMGDKLCIALNDGEDCLVSKIYPVFKIKATDSLMPEFLMLWFMRPEFDRYVRFHSWGSARETFNWEDMCEIRLPIPSPEDQKKYVSLYKGLLSNQNSYEGSLGDLQLICDTFIENLIKNEKPKLLGGYIEQSDNRNSDLKNSNLLGLSINKVFIPSRSKKDSLDLSNYKVVHPREFGFVSVTSRNGEKISIALLNGKAGLLSSTYIVFRVKDYDDLLPEYLYLWFARSEFDRYARFHSWGSARETFDWDDMCAIQLPIPSIEIQKAIVTMYHALETRKHLNLELKNALNRICPIFIKGATEDYSKIASLDKC